jgi:4-amino-4-deoxychorismate lyase
MRQRALELGLAREQRLEPEPQAGDQWLLINSLSCRPIHLLDGWPLDICQDPAGFWRQLL